MVNKTEYQWRRGLQLAPLKQLEADISYVEDQAIESFGVSPGQVLDYKAGIESLCRSAEDIHWDALRSFSSLFSPVEWIYLTRTFPYFGFWDDPHYFYSAGRLLCTVGVESTKSERTAIPEDFEHFRDIDIFTCGYVFSALLHSYRLIKWRAMRRLSYLGAQFVVGENDLRGVARLSGHRLPAEALAIDGRVGRGSNIFSRFGGAVSMRLKSQLHTPQFAAYPLMKAWEQKRHELPGLNIDTRVHTRFQIAPVDLSWLTESLSHPDFDFDGSLYSQSTLNLVLLLNYFTFLLPATVDTYRQVASLGGVFADRSQFDEHLSIHWSEITSPYVGTRVESLLPKSPEDLVRQIVSIRGDPHIGLPPAPIVLEGDRVWIDGAWTVTHIARSRSEGESTRESQRRGKQFEMYVRRIVDTTAWRPDKLRGLVGKKIVKTDGSHLTDIDAIAENNEYVLLISCKSYRSADAVGEMDRASYMNRSSRVVDAIDKWCDVLDAIRSDHGDIVELVGRRKLVGCIVYPDLYYCLDPRALCEGAPGLPFVVSVGEFENYVTTGNVHGRLERH